MSGFQEKLDKITATGAAGGGLVEIDINGKMEVLAVRIAPQAMEDHDMLQDLVMSAFIDVMEKIKETVSKEAGVMAGGLNLPGLPGVM
jgi:DNA-binding YbaB/EbfC family protein